MAGTYYPLSSGRPRRFLGEALWIEPAPGRWASQRGLSELPGVQRLNSTGGPA